MIKNLVTTKVTPESKSKPIPHPVVCSGVDPDAAYEEGGKEGEKMSFIPSKK